MKALTLSDASVMLLALQDEIRRSEDARYDHRLHAVLLVAQGQSCREVARRLGDAPRSVENWVHRFEARGLAGLREGQRAGRPSRLSARQLQRVGQVLRGSPRSAGVEAGRWDGKTLSAWLQKEWAVELKTRQCQRLFRPLRFRLRKPAPMIAPNDPARQAAQKKLRLLALDPKVELRALDEVHFQPHGSRGRRWIAPEIKHRSACIIPPARALVTSGR